MASKSKQNATSSTPSATTSNPLEGMSRAELLRHFAARTSYSPGVRGVTNARIMGPAGDARVLYPRLETPAARATLDLDEAAAVAEAERIIRDALAANRRVQVVEPGNPLATRRIVHVEEFDATQPEVIILNPIIGG